MRRSPRISSRIGPARLMRLMGPDPRRRTGRSMHIIDRRLNPGGKSLANRQGCLRRAKALVQRAGRKSVKDHSIKDLDQQGEVSIVQCGIHEPRLHQSREGGDHDYVLPGNREYVEGDTIPRPRGAAGGGGSEAGTGEGEDEFRFILTREEYLDMFLDDLELPDLAKRQITKTEKDRKSTRLNSSH